MIAVEKDFDCKQKAVRWGCRESALFLVVREGF
jgi:hypothetical protein